MNAQTLRLLFLNVGHFADHLFMLNLVSGAIALLTVRFILASGGGFETVMMVLAAAAVFIVIAALMLPARTGAEMAPDPAAAE